MEAKDVHRSPEAPLSKSIDVSCTKIQEVVCTIWATTICFGIGLCYGG